MKSRNEEGEYEETSGKNNKELIQSLKQKIQAQDDQLDEVIGVVKATNYEAENFKKEATL